MKPKYAQIQHHKKTGTRIFKIYRDMKSRCFNKNDYHYVWYGARGITICDLWLNDFMSFYDWSMKNGYNDSLSINRIDNNKNYCPENCRWVDHKTQCNNRRSNHLITINGKTKTMSQWMEFYGLKENDRSTVKRRIKRGCTGEDIFVWKKKPIHKERIVQKSKDGQIIKIWDSITDAASSIGARNGQIINVCIHARGLKTCCGYIWEFEKRDD